MCAYIGARESPCLFKARFDFKLNLTAYILHCALAFIVIKNFSFFVAETQFFIKSLFRLMFRSSTNGMGTWGIVLHKN